MATIQLALPDLAVPKIAISHDNVISCLDQPAETQNTSRLLRIRIGAGHAGFVPCILDLEACTYIKFKNQTTTLLPFRDLFATAQIQQSATINSATTHAFAWHSQHKTSIQYVSTTYLLGSPGVTMEFWRTFVRMEKKCAPKFYHYPGRYVVLTCCMLVLCCECQAKPDGGRLLFLGVANKFRNGNKLTLHSAAMHDKTTYA